MRCLERDRLFKLIALKEIGQHALPHADNLARALHAVLLFNERTRGSIESWVGDEFDFHKSPPLLVPVNEIGLGGPSLPHHLFNAVQHHLAPVTVGFTLNITADRPTKSIVEQSTGKNAIAPCRVRTGRAVEDFDLSGLSDC